MLKYAIVCALLALAAARPGEPLPELMPEMMPEPEPVAVVQDDGDLDSEATFFHKSIALGVRPASYYGSSYPYAYSNGYHYATQPNYYQHLPSYGYRYHKVLPSFSFHKQIF